MAADDPHAPLRRDVRRLGDLLGEVLQAQGAPGLFEAVEEVRQLAKRAREGDPDCFDALRRRLFDISAADALALSRAFGLFLHLANIAEQHHRVRRRRAHRSMPGEPPQRGSTAEAFGRLRESGVAAEALHEAVCALDVELVLTAHPTEIARRSVLRKFQRLHELLARQEREVLLPEEREAVTTGLRREITSLWHTAEVRHRKPTPVEEAEGGLLVFEESLWDEVPRFLREVDAHLERFTGRGLPLERAPVRFGSWMGGDRDGNPNVTAAVTREVCRLCRRRAAELYLPEVEALHDELSVTPASEALRQRAGGAAEPYRAVLDEVRRRLAATARWYGEDGADGDAGAPPEAVYRRAADLLEPLRACHASLHDRGLGVLADGRLLDVMRRVVTFGLTLVRLDLRQDAARHTRALDAVTRRMGLPPYGGLDEAGRREWLLRSLAAGPPRIAPDDSYDEAEREVLATCALIGEVGPESLGAYVISMAHTASDVLAVEWLQRACGAREPLRVVPLVESLEALAGVEAMLDTLLGSGWYRRRLAEQGDRQEVMVGYSDTAKEAGRLTSAWVLHQAQETIVAACRRHGVRPVLFHGRGGTVGRGGGPTHLAIRSQPPGAVTGELRVTEQGEMIQAKFGLPGVAHRNLELYLTATLEATLHPGGEASPRWREHAEQLSRWAEAAHRAVREQEGFVDYFEAATPVRELARLNVGSRPAKRAGGGDGGLGSLRAIPWVFAWQQVRGLVPGWLGAGEALERALEQGREAELRRMYREWPFFRSTLDLIEMVVAKAEPGIYALYDNVLVPPALRPIGEDLRRRLERTERALLRVAGHGELLAENPVLQRSIRLRNPYVDPNNILQVALLRRVRAAGAPGSAAEAAAEAVAGPSGAAPDAADDPATWDALLSTMNGIAAGMRNTG